MSNAAKRSSEISPEKCSLGLVTSWSLGTLARAASEEERTGAGPAGMREGEGQRGSGGRECRYNYFKKFDAKSKAEIGSWRKIKSTGNFFLRRENQSGRRGGS